MQSFSGGAMGNEPNGIVAITQGKVCFLIPDVPLPPPGILGPGKCVISEPG